MNTNVGFKQVICTITYQIKSSFTCDILLSQNQPPEISFEFGDFKRIKNHKILQIAHSEGIWCHSHSPYVETDKMISFFKKPLSGVAFILLFGVPFNFLDLIMFLGVEFTGTGTSNIDSQPLDWRIYSV